ncbi:MAG: hypothetical protein U1E73_11700 [Planctomycetota bacterium]
MAADVERVLHGEGRGVHRRDRPAAVADRERAAALDDAHVVGVVAEVGDRTGRERRAVEPAHRTVTSA